MNSIIKIYAVEENSESDMNNPCSATFQPQSQKNSANKAIQLAYISRNLDVLIF